MAHPSETTHKQDAAGNNNAVYELYAVIFHRGTAHGGHYRCCVREPDIRNPGSEPDSENIAIGSGEVEASQYTTVEGDGHTTCAVEAAQRARWFDCNDDKLVALPEEALQSLLAEGHADAWGHAYVLIYRSRALAECVRDSDLQVCLTQCMCT
jgi:hypothetical protein